MITETIIDNTLGIKLTNGKLKLTYSKTKQIISYIVFGFFCLLFLGILILGIINLNPQYIFISCISLFCTIFLFLINPYTQNSKNYDITFVNENTLSGFTLFYKEKEVKIDYITDNTGKIAYRKNNSKLECISYADGTNMPNLTKYKIINYFTRWLSENKLLSSEVTTTYE